MGQFAFGYTRKGRACIPLVRCARCKKLFIRNAASVEFHRYCRFVCNEKLCWRDG